MGVRALIGLGSNLGDRRGILDGAVAALAATPGVTVRGVSSYHETAPVGGRPGQGPFLNAAASLETNLDPRALHARLREIENRAGRIRAVRWGERTLDLDLLLFGGLILETPELTVPHPRMALRRFVLAPLVEIAPQHADPVTGRSLQDLLMNLDRRPNGVVLVGPPGGGKWRLFRRLAEGLQATGLASGAFHPELLARHPDTPATIAGLNALRERYRSELAAHRWSFDLWGDRWILTDLWPGQLSVLADVCLGSPEREAFRTELAACEPSLLRPTFYAFWEPPGEHLHDAAIRPHRANHAAVRRSLAEVWSDLAPRFRAELARTRCGVPSVRPGPMSEADFVAEILTICSGTRP